MLKINKTNVINEVDAAKPIVCKVNKPKNVLQKSFQTYVLSFFSLKVKCKTRQNKETSQIGQNDDWSRKIGRKIDQLRSDQDWLEDFF